MQVAVGYREKEKEKKIITLNISRGESRHRPQ